MFAPLLAFRPLADRHAPDLQWAPITTPKARGGGVEWMGEGWVPYEGGPGTLRRCHSNIPVTPKPHVPGRTPKHRPWGLPAPAMWPPAAAAPLVPTTLPPPSFPPGAARTWSRKGRGPGSCQPPVPTRWTTCPAPGTFDRALYKAMHSADLLFCSVRLIPDKPGGQPRGPLRPRCPPRGSTASAPPWAPLPPPAGDTPDHPHPDPCPPPTTCLTTLAVTLCHMLVQCCGHRFHPKNPGREPRIFFHRWGFDAPGIIVLIAQTSKKE